MKIGKSTEAARMILTTLVVLFISTMLLSGILLNNSMATAKALINERMLDIANCGAAVVNGDDLKVLTADSYDTPEYQSVLNSLVVFRDNIDKDHLRYIYCAYQGEDGEFYFSIDPSFDAAPFGQKLIHSDGIYSAIEGTPAVDSTPYSDEWGSFYSAYSPVYDSERNIVGLVIVDFDATWYRNQIISELGVILFVGITSVIINGLAILWVTRKLRHNLSRLTVEMDVLAEEVAVLTEDKSAAEKENGSVKSDRVGETVFRIRSLQKKINDYISRVRSQAYNDAMTGAGNRTAFNEKMSQLNEEIANGTAKFSMVIFDINGLKTINDDNGHEAGDSIINDAASAIIEAFGAERVYRIGGDEFAAILDDATIEDVNYMMKNLDSAVERINKEKRRNTIPLSVSMGAAEYDGSADDNFKHVFKRADIAMYDDKARYYKKIGGRRRSDPQL